ncbi:MAG: SGNH/GDSL hydrolase family protein [Proteobacteria bacterium]|nr:SGNH/GDSL hydrolase family protein [Pseudomonadota bacterium]
MNRLAVTLAASFALLAASATQVRGQECHTHPDVTKLDYTLPRLAEKTVYGLPIKIVALGSSSTAGAGATDTASNYPSRLEVELKALYPRLSITVVNKGVGGETVQDMMARLDDVFAEKPDLIIFQPSTNTVLRSQSVEAAEAKIVEAIQRMQARGIEVILMNDQFVQGVITKPHAAVMRETLEKIGLRYKIGIFRRNELMERWRFKDILPFSVFSHPDNIHMNDWSYRCLSQSLADALGDAVKRAPIYTSLLP